jgi:hypothetical protein
VEVPQQAATRQTPLAQSALLVQGAPQVAVDWTTQTPAPSVVLTQMQPVAHVLWLVFTQLPPLHVVTVGVHLQVVGSSVCPAGQVATQPPPQAVNPVLQAKPQAPPVQVAVALAGVGHATHVPPPPPQAVTLVPARQAPLPSQQPVGQLAAVQTHCPLTQVWPLGQLPQGSVPPQPSGAVPQV